ncbi:hypothetical protein ADL00_16160 [Streptomyces sp. AS58]|uniref:Uncharacterized protein n=1 Tax=Streptomyces cadmiisoli TaxID=2184053 RepID=A0A2Z4JCZ8_9ACTN|nr:MULTISPECIES: hypothetical protein [Streptomyces]AWW43042.1 hypothetical protein DN051_41130 [Streptomyces cadmiisoli]KOV67333.1 hypothetical protein ADL00_16160 [Streptomyces sp. AS58]
MPLLTLQVSRDSGVTWDDHKSFGSSDGLGPLADAGWPPCECRRCRAEEKAAYYQERRRSRR